MAAPFYLSIVELAGHSFDWWWCEIEMDGLSVWLKAIRCARMSLSLTSTLPLAPTMYRLSTESPSVANYHRIPLFYFPCLSLVQPHTHVDLFFCFVCGRWLRTANNAGFTTCDATHPCFGNPRHTPALLPCHTDRCWGVYATDLVLQPADRRCIIRCWSLQITHLLLCLPRHSWKVRH
jgi:hypothetical protein